MNKAEARWYGECSSDEATGLIAQHALTSSSEVMSGKWIVDSGATCHMCQDKELFTDFTALEKPIQVVLGDGRKLEAIGRGTVVIRVMMQTKKRRTLSLHETLLVPGLTYNLLSVSKATEHGKVTVFNESGCEIQDDSGNVVAFAQRVGSLYRLQRCEEGAFTVNGDPEAILWHQRYGHLSESNMNKLSREGMVNDLGFKVNSSIGFCETCVQGKQTRNSFKERAGISSKNLLELVHSDVCGKMGAASLSGCEYVVTFVDDKSRFTWSYPIKKKSDVFSKFREWKRMAEKACGTSVKTLRTDNGGEYTSNEFQEFLKQEGIRHELTVPKTPEQNGIAERLNRTLVEKVRCMLSDAGLPKVFWAEAYSTEYAICTIEVQQNP